MIRFRKLPKVLDLIIFILVILSFWFVPTLHCMYQITEFYAEICRSSEWDFLFNIEFDSKVDITRFALQELSIIFATLVIKIQIVEKN